MRKPKARWVERDRCWVAALGRYNEARKRFRDVVLTDEQGNRIRAGDADGARAAVERLFAERQRRENLSRGMTVADVIVDFLDYLEREGRKPTTLAGYHFHLDRFGAFEHGGVAYCDRAAASIELADLTRIRKTMEERGNQSGYVRHLYAAVLACWRWAARPVEDRRPERLIPSNPFEGIARPKPGKGKKLALRWSQVNALVEFAESRAEHVNVAGRRLSRLRALCLRLIGDSGCRPKEAADLRWEWINFDLGMIVIPWAYHKTGFHDRQDRYFGFTPETGAKLKAHLDSGHANPVFVFAPSRDPRKHPPSSRELRKWFGVLKAAARRAKVNVPAGLSLYTFRRSLPTSAKKGGMSFRDMTLAMGHSEQIAESTYDQPDVETAAAQYRAMHEARLRADEQGPSPS